ncbi:MAG: RluA family pseudouridine synthase [Peptostreptococcales bacterium]
MQYKIQEKDIGLRLSEILKKRLGISSRLISKLKRTDGIFNNGQSVYVSTYPKEGDVISVVLPSENSYFEPEDIPIQTVYEDEDLLIIDKQPGIVVHPTKGHPTGTIANGLVHDMNKKQDVYKIRFINRLDRDTSGLLIIGKSAFAQEALSTQMKENTVVKKYIAILEGRIEEEEGTINKPIKKKREILYEL